LRFRFNGKFRKKTREDKSLRKQDYEFGIIYRFVDFCLKVRKTIKDSQIDYYIEWNL